MLSCRLAAPAAPRQRSAPATGTQLQSGFAWRRRGSRGESESPRTRPRREDPTQRCRRPGSRPRWEGAEALRNCGKGSALLRSAPVLALGMCSSSLVPCRPGTLRHSIPGITGGLRAWSCSARRSSSLDSRAGGELQGFRWVDHAPFQLGLARISARGRRNAYALVP